MDSTSSEKSFDREAQMYTGSSQEEIIFDANPADAISRVVTGTYLDGNEAEITMSRTRSRNEYGHGHRHGHGNEHDEKTGDSTVIDSSASSNEESKDKEDRGFLADMVQKMDAIKGKSTKSMLVVQFCVINVILAAVTLSIISIYWGAAYRTNHYMFKVNIMSVIQDQGYGSIPSIGAVLPGMIDETPGTWHQFNSSTFNSKFGTNSPEEINSKVTRLIYKEKYWMSLNLKEGATESLYNSLTDPNSPPFNSTAFFEVMFESGRDPTNLRAAILPVMEALQAQFVEYFSSEYLPTLIKNITTTEGISLNDIPPINLANAGLMEFAEIDYRPFYDRVLLAPLQVGLIFTLILTVLQLTLYSPLHAKMARVFKPKHLLIYRYTISWATYFILSLFFCTVSAIFQIDFTKAFGKGGFVIYWATTFLVMLALGGVNENALSLVVAYKPGLIPLWMIFFIILNISPSFYPMVLNNQFYRYGYAMPLHNGVDIYRVIFLDVERGKLGRNYGILAAWVVFNHAIFPFIMKIAGTKMKNNAMQQAQAAIDAHEARKQHEHEHHHEHHQSH